MKKRLKVFGVVILAGIFLIGSGGGVDGNPAPKNGKQREYYSNGRLRLYLRFKGGTVIRKRAYYSNGRLRSDYWYKDGRPYKVRNFYDNGKLKSVWTEKSEITRFYTRNGRLKTILKSRMDAVNEKFRSSYIFPEDPEVP